MRMRSLDGDDLSLFATVATFGIAVEVTTSELSIELTFPADEATAEAMRNLLVKAGHDETRRELIRPGKPAAGLPSAG
jgi:hypothetical protein